MIGSKLAFLCIAVQLSGGYEKNIVHKCGLFSKFSSVEKICFQHGNHQSYFLLSFVLSVLSVLFSPNLIFS